jgi:alpha-tubulin suppressor-like RCC1 family protein
MTQLSVISPVRGPRSFVSLSLLVGLSVFGGCAGETAIAATQTVEEIWAGGQHTCAKMDDNTVRCWGWNNLGQVGDGTLLTRLSPVTVPLVGGVSKLAVGYQHTCALMVDNTVRCWGGNTFGQLGINVSGGYRLAPVIVVAPAGAGPLTNVVELKVGSDHTCARRSDNTVYCWGRNDNGQAGNGNTTNQIRPTLVSFASGTPASLALGWLSSCARMSNNTVRCWGDNSHGQIGDGTTTDRLTPTTVIPVSGSGSLSNVTQIGMNSRSFHVCARISDSSVRCWGENQAGQLGDGTTNDRSRPVVAFLGANLSAVQVEAGGDHTCIRQSDHDIRCWGENRDGERGDGTTTWDLDYTQADLPDDAVSLTVGGNHSCALLDNDTAYCWGRNALGRIGDGTTTDRPTPVEVGGCLWPNVMCGSACVDLQTNKSHCGECGDLCPGTETCQAGSCGM